MEGRLKPWSIPYVLSAAVAAAFAWRLKIIAWYGLDPALKVRSIAARFVSGDVMAMISYIARKG